MAKKPNIRFAGFEDDWEQRKLGEVCVRVTRKNKNNESDLPLTIASQYGLIDQRDFFNKVIAAKDMSNYYLLKKGEFAYNKSYSKGFDYGSIKRLNVYEQGCLSTLYICFSIETDEVDSDYLECFFDTLSWYHDVSAICDEGARNHGLLNVDVKAFFKDVNIEMPSQIQEQRKISVFINTLDRLITLHQRKCDELKKVKKFMLQKMFPKKGDKNPEIRFDGFTNDWEQRKFIDIATRGSSVCTSASDIPSVEYEDVVAEEGRLNKDIRSKEVVKSGITFDGSQVLYGKLRPYLHNWLNPDFNGVAVGDWWVLKPINVDKNFLYRLIQTQQFDNIANQSSGSKMPRADWNLISNSEFMVPLSKKEQSKIGRYFDNLDNLITLHQRKCEELKNVKKYMLQNMFAKGE